jgi:hypothetical protein
MSAVYRCPVALIAHRRPLCVALENLNLTRCVVPPRNSFESFQLSTHLNFDLERKIMPHNLQVIALIGGRNDAQRAIDIKGRQTVQPLRAHASCHIQGTEQCSASHLPHAHILPAPSAHRLHNRRSPLRHPAHMHAICTERSSTKATPRGSPKTRR